ncbi:MAG: hypothetical protein WCR51_04730 [Planctomycetia bacterium]
MPDCDFRNLFRTRHDLIQEADRAVAEAVRAFGRAEGDNATRWTVIAAGKCERAAALYLKAGLGLLAKQRYADASRYCCLVGDRERAKLNQDRWAAVSTYWEDDADAASAPSQRKEPHDG